MDSGAGMRLVRNATLFLGLNHSMSYKVLARKWRPQHFNDMLGQEPVLRALVNALDTNRLHHAYLFTGMRGVGKTSIARIFAKCLNCETNGVSANPCGTCSACQDIDAGRFFDLIEVDAASRTKVESTRELLENVPYAPASGRFKVYLIDEVHMFSTHSFNALLKTLEEPPEHVKFLLATTDPQKVPATVLSRCLQFNLKRMSPGMLTDYLSKLLTEEGIEHEMPALDLIARASEGSVRDSLSLVEQAAAGGEGVIRASEVESMLGRASVERLLSLIETLAAGDMPALFAQVDELAEYAPDFSELLSELLSLLHRIALLRNVPDGLSDAVPGYDRLVALADALHADEVQLFYQIGLHARRDMPFAPDPREAFDMALLRMHAFKPQQDVASSATPGAPTIPHAPATGKAGPAQKTITSSAQVAAAAAPSAGSTSQVPAVDSQAPAAASEEVKAPGLAVRGSVSAGGSMRAAALAAARGEPLPDDVAKQIAALNDQGSVPDTPEVEPQQPPQAAAVKSSPAQERVNPAQASAQSSSETRVNGVASQSTPDIPADQNIPADESAATESLEQPPAPVKASPIVKTAIKPTDWPILVTELDIAGMPLQLASHCAWIDIQGDNIKLQLEESSEHLHKPAFVERVQTALNSWLGREIRLSIELVDQVLETPAKLTEKQTADDLAAAHDSIKCDPIVQQLIDKVDAAVDESSIRPIDQ